RNLPTSTFRRTTLCSFHAAPVKRLLVVRLTSSCRPLAASPSTAADDLFVPRTLNLLMNSVFLRRSCGNDQSSPSACNHYRFLGTADGTGARIWLRTHSCRSNPYLGQRQDSALYHLRQS